MKKVLKIMISALIVINNALTIVYADESFSNLEDVKMDIYKHLEDRDCKISFSYTGGIKDFKENISQTIVNAYSLDDYTERSWLEIKPKAEISGRKVKATINVTYLTTKEQELYVENELKKATDSLIHEGMSDLEKVKAVNDYIISRYDYDYTYKSSSAYAALTTGLTICQGYSMTAYKMLNYAGVQNRIVVGFNKGLNHSWNLVRIGESWYHLDITTNDATRSDKYFLKNDSFLEANQYFWNKTNYPNVISSY